MKLVIRKNRKPVKSIKAQSVGCFIITDLNGVPFDGPITPVYFKKVDAQTRSEELHDLKLDHLLLDVTLRDPNALLSKDFTKRYQ